MLGYGRFEVFWHSKIDYKAIDWITKNYLGYSWAIILLLVHMENLLMENARTFVEFDCTIQTLLVLILKKYYDDFMCPKIKFFLLYFLAIYKKKRNSEIKIGKITSMKLLALDRPFVGAYFHTYVRTYIRQNLKK